MEIEREVVLSVQERISKIPFFDEYKSRTAGRVSIAPDAPIKHQAWVYENQLAVPRHQVQHSQQTGMLLLPGQSCQSFQMISQNKNSQSLHFAQKHAQSIQQPPLIEQTEQEQPYHNSFGFSTPQNILKSQHTHFTNINDSILNDKQSQKSRQLISRSQIDLPSISRQLSHDVGIPSQKVYYHYNESRTNQFDTSQMHSRQGDNNYQKNICQSRNSGIGIEKAKSQPQLSYAEERSDGKALDKSRQIIKNVPVQSVEHKEKFDVIFRDSQPENFNSIAAIRTNVKVYRPETSFGLQLEEISESLKTDYQKDHSSGDEESYKISVQKRIEELRTNSINEIFQGPRIMSKNISKVDVQKVDERSQIVSNSTKIIDGIKQSNAPCEESAVPSDSINKKVERFPQTDNLEYGMNELKIQSQGSISDYDKTELSSSNIDSGRGSAAYSSTRRLLERPDNVQGGQDAEWVDIVDSELRNILEPKDMPTITHSNFSDSVPSVTPPLLPLTPQESPRTLRSQFSTSLPYGVNPNYKEHNKSSERRNYTNIPKHGSVDTFKADATKKFNQYFGMEVGDITSTTTGLDLDSMLERSDSDLSTKDARTIRKQLEGLENMYSEVLKLLGNSTKKKKKTRGLANYGSISSLPTSSVSSRPIAKHHDTKRSHNIDDNIKKIKDVKSINKRFQRLESHVVTLARSVAHLSSEMRTQHLMIQEMENIRGEIAALRTQTSMAIVRSQSQYVIKDPELPALSNPSRVKKLTKFFGTEPPLIRLFLRKLGYEKYASAFEKEKVGMVELPYLSEERLQKMGVPLGPRLRILQEARISVCKDPVYFV